ncbi:putative virion structural protein [Acaryochloris phage A-HIS1]|nr:putative virion structural protein [Acaryochloris phage A-HIS1]
MITIRDSRELRNINMANAYTLNGLFYPYEDKDIQHRKDVEYLLGYDVPGHGRLYGNLENNRVPLLSSPFSDHLNEVNRFLFDGGISVDVENAEADDPRQEWIDLQIKHMCLAAKLDDLWERGAIAGEVFAAVQLTRDSFGDLREVYDVTFFDRSEYKPVYDDFDNLIKIKVFSVYVANGKEMVLKRNYTPNFYEVWPEMTLRDAMKKELPDPEIIDHNYGRIPGVIIKNKASIRHNRGLSEFDKGSIDMACEIALQLCDSASNYHFFGDPKILSPDPRVTLEEIRSRAQVWSMDAEETNGKPSYLEIQPIPSDHPKFVETLTLNVRRKLGSPMVNASGVSDGTSSLTLRMLNAATISTAEARWETYVTEGLEPLFECMLIMAAFDGILGNVTPLDPETHSVIIRRMRPYFPKSPQERLTSVTLASELITLGLRPEVVIAEEVYDHLTPEQVAERLEGDLL